MDKRLASQLRGIHSISLLQKTTAHGKGLIILTIILLILCFTGTVQARSEVPSNVVEEKINLINEIILKAGQGITLTRSYTNGTESITLTWTEVSNATSYTIYQECEDGTKLERVVYGTSITLNRNNSSIKDEKAPTKPLIKAIRTSDGLGHNVTIQASTDNGTEYIHTVKTVAQSTNVHEYTEEFAAEGQYTGNKHMISVGKGGTFTVPEGVTRIRVACVGGGGTDSSHASRGGRGEDSYFGNVRATGGTRTSPGQPNGLTYTGKRDGDGFAKSFTMQIKGYYSGGYGGAYNNYGTSAGSGGYISTYIDVTPGQVIPWYAAGSDAKAKMRICFNSIWWIYRTRSNIHFNRGKNNNNNRNTRV